MNEAGNNENTRAVAVPLREKLRRIRDSDHPASPWARNVVQIMDDMKGNPDDPDLLRALGKATAAFECAMLGEETPAGLLSSVEIAERLGLGTHQ